MNSPSYPFSLGSSTGLKRAILPVLVLWMATPIHPFATWVWPTVTSLLFSVEPWLPFQLKEEEHKTGIVFMLLAAKPNVKHTNAVNRPTTGYKMLGLFETSKSACVNHGEFHRGNILNEELKKVEEKVRVISSTTYRSLFASILKLICYTVLMVESRTMFRRDQLRR